MNKAELFVAVLCAKIQGKAANPQAYEGVDDTIKESLEFVEASWPKVVEMQAENISDCGLSELEADLESSTVTNNTDEEAAVKVNQQQDSQPFDFAAMGFEGNDEFIKLTASADLSSPEKLSAFQDWKENDGTKKGLLNLT